VVSRRGRRTLAASLTHGRIPTGPKERKCLPATTSESTSCARDCAICPGSCAAWRSRSPAGRIAKTPARVTFGAAGCSSCKTGIPSIHGHKARFKCQILLDENAVLSAMTYDAQGCARAVGAGCARESVDLNPVRAKNLRLPGGFRANLGTQTPQ